MAERLLAAVEQRIKATPGLIEGMVKYGGE